MCGNYPLVSIIIPTRNSFGLIRNCINSILDRTNYSNYEILIIDNQTEDEEALEYLDKINAEHDNVFVLKWSRSFNYSAINNYGVKHANGDFICLLNNDTEIITPGWLGEMVAYAAQADIGCVGAMLYYQDNTIQHAGVVLGIGGNHIADHVFKRYNRSDFKDNAILDSVREVSAVTAACLVVKKNIYEQVDGFDDDNLKIAYNDVDFCLKVREEGYRNLFLPHAELYHFESRSRSKWPYIKRWWHLYWETRYMKKKWGDKLLVDPYGV